MSLRKACEDAGLPGLHNETLIFFLSLSFSLPIILTLSISLFLFLIYLYVCVCKFIIFYSLIYWGTTPWFSTIQVRRTENSLQEQTLSLHHRSQKSNSCHQTWSSYWPDNELFYELLPAFFSRPTFTKSSMLWHYGHSALTDSASCILTLLMQNLETSGCLCPQAMLNMSSIT